MQAFFLRRGADACGCAEIPVYQVPHLLSSVFCAKIAQISIPNFVQFYLLTNWLSDGILNTLNEGEEKGMMNKTLVFDMDGTIANLYGVDNWLEDLRSENARPYAIAKPLYDMDTLNEILNILKSCGWCIVVTSWLAKGSTKAYDKKVRKAKKEWLEKYNFPVDEIHLVKYGTTKADCTRKKGGVQILIDDNEKVRKGWHLGGTIDANRNIIESLVDLLVAEW